MREICIEDFLLRCNPNYVERHSDSSDFEKPCEIPIIASKGGNHRLLSGKTCNTACEKPQYHYHVNKMPDAYNCVNLNKTKATDIKIEQKIFDSNIHINRKSRFKTKNNFHENISRNQGDQKSGCYLEHVNPKSHLVNRATPCLSTIFRFRNNCMKRISSIEENQAIITNNCDETYCPICESRCMKKYKRRRRCSVHPVYAVEENVQDCPFKTINNDIPATKPTDTFKNSCSGMYNDTGTSESELETMNAKKYKKFLKMMRYGYEKEKVLDRFQYNVVKNYQQQYPSKLQIKPYQVFTSSSCQAKCSSSGSEKLPKIPSSSSAFWDFFASKVKNKLQKPATSKSCDCIKPPEPCSPENCEHFKGTHNLTPENTESSDADKQAPILSKSCCQQTDDRSSQSSSSYKKKKKEPKVICKCYPNKKKDSKSKKLPLVMQQDEPKPCQEDHDAITRAISEKYKGEILCIHNPPCILINGCLNLPPPKSNFQADLWPVTQSKKSSFVQMCRKIKRSKQRNDQACQYHPPLIELQEYLPEFKTEKIIQSVCNHDPPCQVVHGCYKVPYDPKLQNSCVHVPMCENVPTCLMPDKNEDLQNGSCTHNPKCTKLPVCSRNYITLTAKEHIGTQVKRREKMICRHQPQCFMIPKCLTQAIRDNYIPYGAIPGCVHHPRCEMIPACCRKTTKEMVSVPSQYPNACRIV